MTQTNRIWRIARDINDNNEYRIFNDRYDKLINTVYNYQTRTPLVLCPQNDNSVFVLSSINDSDKLLLTLSDLRVHEDELIFGFEITIRGKRDSLSKFRNSIVKSADSNKCVGVAYLLRKLYNYGFKTLYSDRILKPKETSVLRNAVDIIANTASL